MAVVDELGEAIAEMGAVDHHAHLLVEPDAAPSLEAVLTESSDPTQIDMTREHPAYVRALIELANADREGLFERCGFEAMFVDDGFRPTGVVTLEQHAALVGCPVRRIVRIETEAEAVVDDWPAFGEMRDRFRQAIVDAFADGAVGLKTIAAYRCGLDLPAPSADVARKGYEAWRRSGRRRLAEPALIVQLIADALEVVGPSVPLQVHTGLGDADQLLTKADPALLQEHVDHGFLTGNPVILLHCYPYVREAGCLASIYANVHLDLSLAMTLMPHRGRELILEALELAPATKLLFATDASRLPEMFLIGALSWRSALSQALGHLVDDGFVAEDRARRWAELILAGNAKRVYGDIAGNLGGRGLTRPSGWSRSRIRD